MKHLIFISILFSFVTASAVNRPLSDDAFKKNIVFASGSGKLTLDQQISLIKIVQGLDKRGADLNISLAAWSDNKAPSSEGEALSQAQQELAAERLKAVRKYIKEIGFFGKISLYNMAEPMTLEEVSEDSANTTLLKEKYSLFKSKGGIGKVTMVITKK